MDPVDYKAPVDTLMSKVQSDLSSGQPPTSPSPKRELTPEQMQAAVNALAGEAKASKGLGIMAGGLAGTGIGPNDASIIKSAIGPQDQAPGQLSDVSPVQAQQQQAVDPGAPNAPPPTEQVYGTAPRVIPGGHSAPELAGLYQGDKTGMTAVGARAAYGEDVRQKAKDLAMTAAEAQAVGDAVRSNALVNNMKSVEQSNARIEADQEQLRARAKELEGLLSESRRIHSEPSKFFDPVTGGATGFMGFLARVSWALASPDYQRNTIAAANSMAEQDYRAKMLKRNTMEGRIKSSQDALAFWERRYHDKYAAEQAFKIDARQRLMDSVAAIGAMSNNPVIAKRTQLVYAELDKQNEEERQALFAATYKPPRVVGGGSPVVRDKSGKVTGVKGVTGSGRPIQVDATELASAPTFRLALGGQNRIFRANSDVEAKEMGARMMEANGALRGLDNAANILRQAEKASGKQREEMLRAAAREIAPAYGTWLKVTNRGAPTGAENSQALEAVTGGFEASAGPFAKLAKKASDFVSGKESGTVEQFRSAVEDTRGILNGSISDAAQQFQELQVEEAVSPTGHKTSLVIERQDRPSDTAGQRRTSGTVPSRVK